MNSFCKCCGNSLGELEDGDVVQCLRVKCAQWHWLLHEYLWAGKPGAAALLALEMPPGMDNYDLLTALYNSEQAMMPEDFSPAMYHRAVRA